jgi:hypothetical protein
MTRTDRVTSVQRFAFILATIGCSTRPAETTPVANAASTSPATETASARCDRIAAEIAKVPGGLDCCGYAGRRRLIGEHCTEHGWPASVDACGDPEPGDKLACPAAMGLDSAQATAWGELFERLYGDPCRC